jgi:TET-Associated Glycosyltransferase
MFENLQIVIPSRSRPQNVKTIYNLSESLWPNITVVVPYDQYGTYRSFIPVIINVISFEGSIGPKRNFILHLRRNGKLIMMDDDLKFYKRTEDGTRFPGTLKEQTILMIGDIITFLNNYAMVGLTDKFMSQTKPRGYVECHRFNQVLGINRDLLPNPWPQFRLSNDEEHDVHLQLLTRGYKTAVLTEWSKSDIFDAPGGCSDWRNLETLAEAHKKLLKYWPGIVSIDTKDRPKARYNWQEAKKIGGI